MAFGCKFNNEEKKNEYQALSDNQLLKEYILEHMTSLEASVAKMETTRLKEAQDYFIEAHETLKKIESFLTYITPEKMKGVNGPPLPVFREDNGKVLPAIGFQALEEQLFSGEPLDSISYLERVDLLKGYLKGIKQTIAPARLSERHLFIPIHQQLFTIFSLGIISFDTPVTTRGIEESVISLNSIKEVYGFTLQDSIQKKNAQLHNRFVGNINSAINYLKQNTDFETFNRYAFTREHLNPLTKDWVDIRKASGVFEAPKRMAINMDAPTFFEENSFNPNFFLKLKNAPGKEMVKLGELLFFDNNLSASQSISCASCHDPNLAYQDGLKVAIGKNGKQLKRNTPTVINSVFQQKFFWDGRSDDLVQQINLVFANEDEFDKATAHAFSLTTLDSLKYNDLVAKSFPQTKKLNKKSVSRAISAYVATLNAFNSKFDKDMRGETNDFTEEEILGMNLYMGKALCATCHFLPLTSGTVPPNLKDTEKEVIGTPKTDKNKEIDPDEGFYWVYEEDIHKYMFKTPSIRNIELTAPYMHNGAYKTLEQIMDFYNKGGGGGLGFDLDHQTLPFDNLNLTEKEQQAIIAFMKTLTDVNIKKAEY